MLELSLQTSFTTFCSEVPTTVPPQLQRTLLVENINGIFMLEIKDNNSISSSAFKNLSE